MLELSVRENPEDDRGMFWLGREYMYHNMPDKCINTLTDYLKIHTRAWDEERSAAMRFISKCYKGKGNLKEAKNWLFRAIAECPRVREPYLYMAKLGYDEKNWPLVYLMVAEALKITEKSGNYLLETSSWDYTFYDLGAISSYYLELYEISYKLAQKACEMNEEDQRLRNNLELIKMKLNK